MTSGNKLRRTGIIAARMLAAMVISGCAQTHSHPASDLDGAHSGFSSPRPDYPGYGTAAGMQALPWAAASLADDFISLNFEGEGGIRFDRLIRWEGPVRVALADAEITAYRDEVADLIERIKTKAPDLDLRLSDGRDAEITLRTAPREKMQAFARDALCFIAPTRLSWDGYVAEAKAGKARWRGLDRFEAMTIFIPEGAAPHVYRSCIFEELTQALGPLNDLYLLEDSGFNDDEVHIAPTRFDYLMIGLLYAPELAQRMTRDEAHVAVLTALARMGYFGIRARARGKASDQFAKAFMAARQAPPTEAVAAAERAIEIAQELPTGDHRLGEALRHLMLIEIRLGEQEKALGVGKEALAEMAVHLPMASPRLARMRADLGFLTLSLGDTTGAISLLEKAEPVLAAHRLDATLAVSLRLRALALTIAGRTGAAAKTAKDALAWASYVFGPDSVAVTNWRSTFRELNIPL